MSGRTAGIRLRVRLRLTRPSLYRFVWMAYQTAGIARFSASLLDLRHGLCLGNSAGGTQDIAEHAFIVRAPREVVSDHCKHATPIPDNPLSPVAHDRETFVGPRIHIRVIETSKVAQRSESPLKRLIKTPHREEDSHCRTPRLGMEANDRIE